MVFAFKKIKKSWNDEKHWRIVTMVLELFTASLVPTTALFCNVADTNSLTKLTFHVKITKWQ